jgi:hypothetical protein
LVESILKIREEYGPEVDIELIQELKFGDGSK